MGTEANNPNLVNVNNLNKLAEFCATSGDYPQAIDYYLKLTNIDPENGPAWTALVINSQFNNSFLLLGSLLFTDRRFTEVI